MASRTGKIRVLLVFLNLICLFTVALIIGRNQRVSFQKEKKVVPEVITNTVEQAEEHASSPQSFTSDDLQGDFQPVNDLIQTFVYSAIYDDIETPIIRVLSLVRDLQKESEGHRYSCVYKGTSQDQDVTTEGSIQYVPEPKWGYKYRSAFIRCNVPNGNKPLTVTVNQFNKTGSGNRLRVIYPMQRKYNLTRCFSAIHSNFNNTLQFIQVMELSMLFGVEHFVVYNYSIHPRVLSVMEEYRKLGVLEILPWKLPINKTDIHYYAQLTAIQECLYRKLHVSDYILTGDTDEVFVPKLSSSSLNVIQQQFRTQKPCSCLVIRNAFFPVNLPSYSGDFALKSEASNLKLTFLLKSTHTRIFSPYDRSKLVIKPPGVEIAGIHGVEKYRKGHKGCVCPIRDCLLHHYRSLPANELSSFRQTDTSLHKYSKTLTLRISNRLRQWGIS